MFHQVRWLIFGFVSLRLFVSLLFLLLLLLFCIVTVFHLIEFAWLANCFPLRLLLLLLLLQFFYIIYVILPFQQIASAFFAIIMRVFSLCVYMYVCMCVGWSSLKQERKYLLLLNIFFFVRFISLSHLFFLSFFLHSMILVSNYLFYVVNSKTKLHSCVASYLTYAAEKNWLSGRRYAKEKAKDRTVPIFNECLN